MVHMDGHRASDADNARPNSRELILPGIAVTGVFCGEPSYSSTLKSLSVEEGLSRIANGKVT